MVFVQWVRQRVRSKTLQHLGAQGGDLTTGRLMCSRDRGRRRASLTKPKPPVWGSSTTPHSEAPSSRDRRVNLIDERRRRRAGTEAQRCWPETAGSPQVPGVTAMALATRIVSASPANAVATGPTPETRAGAPSRCRREACCRCRRCRQGAGRPVRRDRAGRKQPAGKSTRRSWMTRIAERRPIPPVIWPDVAPTRAADRSAAGGTGIGERVPNRGHP